EWKAGRLSPQQRRVWSLGAEGKAADRVQGVFRIDGGAEAAVLRERAEQLVNHQEILRTIYRRASGLKFPRQVVLPELPFVFRADERPAADGEATLRRILDEEAAAPLDPEKGPLFRVRRLPVTPSEALVFVTVSSLAADRRSLESVCRALASGISSPPAETLQYADYSEWANEMLEPDSEGGGGERGRAFAVPRLPFERGARAGISSARVAVRLPASLASRVQAAASRGGANLEEFLLACWVTLLSRWTEDVDLEVRQVLDGRTQPELSEAIGLFSRALSVGARIEPSTTFEEVLRATAKTSRENAEKQDSVAGEDVRSAAVGFDGPGESVSRLVDERAVLESFKLCLSFRSGADGLSGAIAYDAAAYAA